MTLAEKIIEKNNLPTICKKKHGTSPEVSTKDFISVLLEQETSVKTAQAIGIGEQTVNRILQKYFRPVFGTIHGGNETWSFILLKSIEYKRCHCCGDIKPYSKFGLDKHTTDGRFKKCKYCRSFDNASLYNRRKLRIPSWNNLEKEAIAEFYENCPEGYHVDHIIPLQGEYISGLHTLSNLQYLPAKDNIKKGNSWGIGEIW